MNPLVDSTLNHYKRAFFLGIGGIGMSALARYFKFLGWEVAGYDKTETILTKALETEGMNIHYSDHEDNIPESFKELSATLFVYTPAIPKNSRELIFLIDIGAKVFKRSQVLGLITNTTKGIAVAGTHGKTTTSSMLAFILSQSTIRCNAFLGGIASNFNSNLVVDENAELTVLEADEFDRSFLNLKPFSSIITSTDPDHLDIYGDNQEFLKGFQDFAKLTNENGCLILKEGLQIQVAVPTLTYGINSSFADFTGKNLRFENGFFKMDVQTPSLYLNDVELGIPGIHNAENALACIAMSFSLGLTEFEIRSGLKDFKGVKRRFEYIIRNDNLVYIDDYAHHPTEINALINSVRMLYPNKKITGIFQPHLFSRTKDFFNEFAIELSNLDEVILMPIYPARELPIPGVTSNELMKRISQMNKQLLAPNEIVPHLMKSENEVVLTIGAGDIDKLVLQIKAALS